MKLKKLFTFNNFLKATLLGIVAFLLLVVFKIYHLFSVSSYDEIVSVISNWVGKPEWKQQLQSLFKLEDFHRILKIKDVTLAFVLIILGFLLLKMNTITKNISNYIVFVVHQLELILASFKRLTLLEQTLLTLIAFIFLAKAYYYVFTWPIQYDEAWTFSYYINNSWLTPFITPHNNHILYTILAKLTYHLLPFEAIYSIRFLLPIYSLVTAILLFYACSKYLKREVAVICFIIFLATPGVIFYSLYARAYSLSMIFAAINLICALQVFQTNHLSKNSLISLVLSSVLGMYSLPSFAYFSIGIFTTLGIFSVLKTNFVLLKWLVISGILYVLGTAILYSPMIMATKLSWLTEAVENTGLKPDVLPLVYKSLLESARFYLGNDFRYTYSAFVLFAFVLMCFQKKNRVFYFLLGFLLIIPVSYIVLKKQFLSERFFAFNTVASSLLICSILYVLLKKQVKLLYIVSLLLFSYWSYHAHFQKFLNWSNQYDYTIRKMSYILMDEKIDTTYLFLNYAKPGIGYHFDVNKKPVQLYLPNKASKDYRPFSYQGEFPAILIDTSRQVYPSIDRNIYKLRFKEKELELYVRKK